MLILSTEQASFGCIKITVDSGLAFFIRTIYLKIVKVNELSEGALFEGDKEEDIINAGMIFQAERKAYDYLMRAEQSRFILERKLSSKNFDAKHISAALDYLEKNAILSDERFARAWLNTRKASHSEGRSKLERELYTRGISKYIAAAALDEFYSENSEESLCLREYEKCKRLNKTYEQIVKRLISCGFAYKMIKNIMKNCEMQEKPGLD